MSAVEHATGIVSKLDVGDDIFRKSLTEKLAKLDEGLLTNVDQQMSANMGESFWTRVGLAKPAKPGQDVFVTSVQSVIDAAPHNAATLSFSTSFADAVYTTKLDAFPAQEFPKNQQFWVQSDILNEVNGNLAAQYAQEGITLPQAAPASGVLLAPVAVGPAAEPVVKSPTKPQRKPQPAKPLELTESQRAVLGEMLSDPACPLSAKKIAQLKRDFSRDPPNVNLALHLNEAVGVLNKQISKGSGNDQDKSMTEFNNKLSHVAMGIVEGNGKVIGPKTTQQAHLHEAIALASEIAVSGKPDFGPARDHLKLAGTRGVKNVTALIDVAEQSAVAAMSDVKPQVAVMPTATGRPGYRSAGMSPPVAAPVVQPAPAAAPAKATPAVKKPVAPGPSAFGPIY